MVFEKSANLHLKIQCVVKENIHTTPRMVIENSEVEGGPKAKIFKGKYEANLENPDRWEGLN